MIKFGLQIPARPFYLQVFTINFFIGSSYSLYGTVYGLNEFEDILNEHAPECQVDYKDYTQSPGHLLPVLSCVPIKLSGILLAPMKFWAVTIVGGWLIYCYCCGTWDAGAELHPSMDRRKLLSKDHL